jgi:quercetin dioxygenase-like cupin family protein
MSAEFRPFERDHCPMHGFDLPLPSKPLSRPSTVQYDSRPSPSDLRPTNHRRPRLATASCVHDRREDMSTRATFTAAPRRLDLPDIHNSAARPKADIPDDDPKRNLAIATPADPATRHLSVAGGAYAILLTGDQTGGRYCLIDMRVPPGGGPPPHRHDFEEMFTILEGEIELTFRGEKKKASAGSTVNIPANAPHSFKNLSDKPARLLCLCTPPGQEKFFLEVGDPIDGPTAPPPTLSKEEQAQRIQRAKALAPKYRTELLIP